MRIAIDVAQADTAEEDLLISPASQRLKKGKSVSEGHVTRS
jgi:hypothetical protein